MTPVVAFVVPEEGQGQSSGVVWNENMSEHKYLMEHVTGSMLNLNKPIHIFTAETFI